MKARQLSTAHTSVYALGMIDQLRVIERSQDGLWGRWLATGVHAKHVAHAGDVVARIGLDDRVAAMQRTPRRPWTTWDLHATEIVATRLADGAPALFAADATGRVWHALKPSPRAPWTNWELLGGPATDLAAALIPTGGLVVFGLRHGMVVHRWQERPHGPWADWTPIDASIGEVVRVEAVGLTGGGLALFALVRDGTLHHRWQEKPFARWQPWERLGSGITTMAAARATRGGLAVFTADTEGQVQVRVQLRPFGAWNGWEDLHGRAKRLAAQPSWTDGLEVFAIGADDEVYHAWCERLDWPWTPWRLLEHEKAPAPLT